MNEELWTKLDKLRDAEIFSPEEVAPSRKQHGIKVVPVDLSQITAATPPYERMI
jgi:hypothetical protein